MEQTNLLKCKIKTALGNIFILGNNDYITSVSWETLPDKSLPEHTGELNWFADELSLYLKGALKVFTGRLSFRNNIPIWLRKSAEISIPNNLSEKVMGIISEIPYGKTKTYGSIATDAGNSGLARAVGGICGKNPLIIIVPCHRVIAASTIGGYSAGLSKKRYLLKIEGVDIQVDL
jgi:methylated-DNA-[protein]-cysteine S-methyltransferase